MKLDLLLVPLAFGASVLAAATAAQGKQGKSSTTWDW
jgi:hypothetical protein